MSHASDLILMFTIVVILIIQWRTMKSYQRTIKLKDETIGMHRHEAEILGKELRRLKGLK